MKKQIFKIVFIITVGVVIGYNVKTTNNMTPMSAVAMHNVMALVTSEETDVNPITCRWSMAYEQCYKKISGSVCLLVDLGSCRWLDY
ncbi:NVEALA domain-containing protein [Bacteroides sp. OttesenSCG-928-J23]|nr:NVEALA domain-containing protein [Bacteroides sp. OttesenSCG-928-J23]MDL2306027.1 NVEALA domain-containing protein [Bacteroides sp. OttesenSCG-928-D19]